MGQTTAAGILRTLYLDGCMYYLVRASILARIPTKLPILCRLSQECAWLRSSWFVFFPLLYMSSSDSIIQYYLGSESLILLMPYLEYALTSAVTSRWFLSFRRTLVDTFETQHTEADVSGIPFTGATISFGHRRNGSVLARARQPETFLSSYYAPSIRHTQSLERNDDPIEVGFSNSMTHELKTLDSHPHPDDWNKDV